MRVALRLAFGLCTLAGLAQPPAPQTPQVDPRIPPYRKEAEFPVMRSVGSDTLVNLMTFWGEAFGKHHPTVRIPIEAKGSSTAPPALTEGLSQLAPMSREMKADEVARFEKRKGYPPIRVTVAIDALTVFVNKDNPLKSLSLPQVDAIFSKTRQGGHPEDIAAWGQLGLPEPWAKAPIALVGRNSLSGTYGYFLEHALYKGAFKPNVKEEGDSMAVAWSVAEDKFAIGYSGLGYLNDGVRALAIATGPGEPAVEPTYQNAVRHTYPLARRLYVYIDKAPGKPLTPLVREFLRFVLSREGQEIVAGNGFLPLDADTVRAELTRLD